MQSIGVANKMQLCDARGTYLTIQTITSFYTPRACIRDKVIGRVVVVSTAIGMDTLANRNALVICDARGPCPSI